MTSLDKPIGQHKTPARRRCLEMNVKLLYYYGIWPADGEEKRNWLFYVRLILPRAVIFRAIYGSVFHVINIVTVWGELTRMAEYFIMINLHVLIGVHTATSYYYREELISIFDELERLHEPRMVFDDHTKKCLKDTERWTHTFTKVLSSVMAVLLVICQILAVIEGLIKRVIPFRLWMPYDYQSSPLFELTLMFSTLLPVFDMFVVPVCLTSFFALAILTVGQFQLLSYKLENIQKLVEDKLEKKKDMQLMDSDVNVAEPCDGADMSTASGRILSGFKSNDTNCRKHSAVNVRLNDKINTATLESELHIEHHYLDVPSMRISESVENKTINRAIKICSHTLGVGQFNNNTVAIPFERRTLTSNDILTCVTEGNMVTGYRWQVVNTEKHLELERLLRHCIKHHQKILSSITTTLGVIFKRVLALYIFMSAIGGFGLIYLTTLAESMDAKVMTIISLMCSLYIVVLCMCLVGGRLTEEAENVRLAVYGCDWFSTSESFKQSMRIMISRMNRPLVIKAGGLPLSVGTYRMICRASYYGHMILSKLFYGEKIIKQK